MFQEENFQAVKTKKTQPEKTSYKLLWETELSQFSFLEREPIKHKRQ